MQFFMLLVQAAWVSHDKEATAFCPSDERRENREPCTHNSYGDELSGRMRHFRRRSAQRARDLPVGGQGVDQAPLAAIRENLRTSGRSG